MKSTEIDQNAVLATEKAIPENTLFIMLNLLRFKEQADYGDRKDEKPCSGMEAYIERYVPAFNKVVAAEGTVDIQLTYVGAVNGHVVAPPNEHWDIVALAQYPNFAAFRKVTESPLYKATAEHHRLAALEDLRLIATVKADIV